MEYNDLEEYEIEPTDDPNGIIYENGDMVVADDGTIHMAGEFTGEEEEFIANGTTEESEAYNETYLDGEFQETQTVLVDGGDRFGVSSLVFDSHEELLWMGNQGGHVTSYYGPGLQRYTSFQVHADQEVRHLSTFDQGILALTKSTLRCQIRRGIPVYTHSSENMSEMQCLLPIATNNVIMGGHQDKLILFDINQAVETSVVQVGENGCAILRRHGRFLCSGDPTGKVELRDPLTLNLEHSLEAHTGSLSDFDVHENLLVTCGFSKRANGLSVDRLLMVYDLRMLRAVSPMQVLIDPLLLRFLPTFSSRLAVVSSLGQFQLLDTVALSEPEICLYQINSSTSLCQTFDISSTCQCMAFGDSGGQLHLFSSHSQALFNPYSRNTVFADPPEQLNPISYEDNPCDYSHVPLPQTNGPLLSDWAKILLTNVEYRPTPDTDPDILRNVKMVGNIGYAPNDGNTRRNQVPYKLEIYSEIDNETRLEGGKHNKNEDSNFIAIPKRYRKIDVKYSKMGMDDFDFDYYNKTSFSGLEATLPNSYCNAMLQVLYFIDHVRALTMSHLCTREFCLTCELGFLFHMIDNSQGFPCQASNFLRAFRTIPEASALGLILSDDLESMKKTDLSRLIQNWNRFILHQLHFEILEARKRKIFMEKLKKESKLSSVQQFVYQEQDFPIMVDKESSSIANEPISYNDFKLKFIAQEGNNQDINIDINEVETENRDEVTEISDLFGTKQIITRKCIRCKTEVNKESTQFVWNLVYHDPYIETSFCELLKRSLSPEQTTPAWCDNCSKYQPTAQARKLKNLPNILALNSGLDNPEDKTFWQHQMDILVNRAQENTPSPSTTTTSTTNTTTSTSTTTTTTTTTTTPQPTSETGATVKLCRYGDKCTRPGCRFRHSDRTEPIVSNVPHSSHLYYTHSWLPLNIQVKLGSDGELSVIKNEPVNIVPQPEESNKDKKEDEEEELIIEEKESFTPIETVNYDLCAVVCYIHDPANLEKKNLIALINVGPKYHQRLKGSPVSQWYIFNDFSINPIQNHEVVWFNFDWKVPCVLYWINKDYRNITNIPQEINPITLDVFGEDECLARNGKKMITFTPLSSDEMLKEGELVAVDAEFVTLNQEEAELRIDGKTNMIKPSHMSVARITCVRGQGPLEGTPFIDDYISTQEQVVDYLTKFSGIKPGDLDANFSSKHLTTLKSTYQKLRFLIHSGVKFVGHGLKNDFRVINLVVPADQVIDTVHLFHLPHHRMVSLRFLTWHFLGMKIQSETHDSIEDARAALHLYKHYLKLEESKNVIPALKELYQIGKKYQWKVPDTEQT